MTSAPLLVGLAAVSISIGNGAVALLLLPLLAVAVLWIARGTGAEPAPSDERAQEPPSGAWDGRRASARLRRGAVRWLVATAVSLALTLYIARGWTSSLGHVLLATVLVTIVVRYPFWWAFRAFSWALRWTLVSAREARSTGARIATAGLGLLLLPGLVFFAFWAFAFPALFFWAWAQEEKRIARATPALTEALAPLLGEVAVRSGDDDACRRHGRLDLEFDDVIPRYCVVGLDGHEPPRALSVVRLRRSEAAERPFRLDAVQSRYAGVLANRTAVLYPLPAEPRLDDAAAAAAAAISALEDAR